MGTFLQSFQCVPRFVSFVVTYLAAVTAHSFFSHRMKGQFSLCVIISDNSGRNSLTGFDIVLESAVL